MNKAETSDPSFPPTRWTMIHRIQHGNEQESAEAFSELCERYWYPIYAYLRRVGKNQEDAEDLTQMFFVQLIRDETLQSAREQKGKLRSFLLGSLKRMLSKQNRYENAEKRGGRSVRLSIDAPEFERLYIAELTDGEDPEQMYFRTWARTTLQNVQTQLKAEFAENGKAHLFDLLDPYLFNDEAKAPYEQLAAEMDSTAGAVRLLVHRLRKKFRESLEDEIRETVSSPEEVAEEMKWLNHILSGANV